MAKRIKNRVVSSVAITVEQHEWLKNEGLSLSDLVQKMLDARMSGIYDENREAVMDVLWERFKRFVSYPNARTIDMVHSWLGSPGWSDELKAIGMTPHGFLVYVKRRVEQDPGSPIELRIAVGLEKVKPYKMPTDEELEREKSDFLKKGQSKGLHVERMDDDARPLKDEEAKLYEQDAKRGRGQAP